MQNIRMCENEILVIVDAKLLYYKVMEKTIHGTPKMRNTPKGNQIKCDNKKNYQDL